MIVKDLMTTAVTSVPPDSPAAAAVKIMRSEDVGIVPVCDIQGHLLHRLPMNCKDMRRDLRSECYRLWHFSHKNKARLLSQSLHLHEGRICLHRVCHED